MILLTLRLTDTDSRFAEDETHSAGILKCIALRIGEIDRGWILNFMCVGLQIIIYQKRDINMYFIAITVSTL